MAKSEFMKIRLSTEEKLGFEDAASLAGLTLSAWIRERLRITAIKELEDADRPIPFIPPVRARS